MIKAYAPGKIMIAGEYSVLAGGRALAVTTDHVLNCWVTENTKGWILDTNLWPAPRFFLIREELNDDEAFEQVVKNAAERFCKVVIRSDLAVEHGVGSSSALRLAVLAALKNNMSLSTLEQAYDLQKSYQNQASGYDLATQYYGGVSVFKNPGEFQKWTVETLDFKNFMGNILQHITVFVSKTGAPTKVTMQKNAHWFKNQFLIAQQSASEELIDSLMHYQSFQDVLDKIVKFRNILEESPAYPRRIHSVLSSLKGFDKKWTFKPTGAGGEDAILLFGKISAEAESALLNNCWLRAPFSFAEKKLTLEEMA